MQTAIQRVREFSGVSKPVSMENYKTMAREFSDHVKRETGKRPGWLDHSATLMWVNNVEALMLYGDVCIREWRRRGYKNTMPIMISASEDYVYDIQMPYWLGDCKLHRSHRSNLLRKDEEFYRKQGWTETTDIEYVWPEPRT